MTETRRFTISNAVTATRLAAVPFFYCAVVAGAWPVACVLFWWAVATDVLDGRLARARGESSAFGGLLDHASDATFVACGLAALASRNLLTGMLPLLVAAAFVQYVLDSRSLEGQALRASRMGRWNGILYFVLLGTVVTRESLGIAQPGDAFVRAFAYGLVGTTLVSMADRFGTLWRARAERARPDSPNGR